MLREESSTLLFDNYIISMTHEASHILKMRLLASFAGLAGRRWRLALRNPAGLDCWINPLTGS
jgi:phosphoenolpyruvate carboxylase